MAIGWLAVLKMVPWSDVIENAPKVASGAKKLWNSVGKKSAPGTAAKSDALTAGVPGLASLQAQIAELQAATADLHQQMLQSSELIESLAVQNTQLIERLEVNRKRVLWLGALVFGLALASLISRYH